MLAERSWSTYGCTAAPTVSGSFCPQAPGGVGLDAGMHPPLPPSPSHFLQDMAHSAGRAPPTSVAASAPTDGGSLLRRISTSSVASTSTGSTSGSPTLLSSSLPASAGLWPMERMSSLFRTTSLPYPQGEAASAAQRAAAAARAFGAAGSSSSPRHASSYDGPAAVGAPKVPYLVRTLSKGMDSFR